MVSVGTVYHCRIINDTIGKKSTQTRVKTKTFQSGKELDLMAINMSSSPSNYLVGFVTKDGYTLPKIAVLPLREASMQNVSDAIVLEENGQPVKSSREKVEEELAKRIKPKNNFAVYGGVLGGAFGMLQAYKSGNNKILYPLLGIAIGGYVGVKINNLNK